jgi:hypothetical protein
MRRMLTFLMALSCAGLSAATAEEYWIAYEGNDFPENEGWTREYGDENGHGQGGAERWLEDGALVLDGRRHPAIYDGYVMSRPIDPAPAEVFIMAWRLKVEEVSAYEDPTVVVFSDESWAVGFEFSETYLNSGFEPGVSVDFEPGVFHDFELRSSDMRAYALAIDGSVALNGQFVEVITASEVAWGDGVVGSASLSRWDYFRFGVVPEPGILSMLALGLFVGRRLS